MLLLSGFCVFGSSVRGCSFGFSSGAVGAVGEGLVVVIVFGGGVVDGFDVGFGDSLGTVTATSGDCEASAAHVTPPPIASTSAPATHAEAMRCALIQPGMVMLFSRSHWQ